MPAMAARARSPSRAPAFKYLAASTVVDKTGQTLFPAYQIKRFQGIPVAFIGLTLQATPSIVVPATAWPA